jgi:integrase
MSKQKKSAMSGLDILRDPSKIDLTENQEAACPAFRVFLLEHRTVVGDVLLGDKAGPWTKTEMRDFEDMITHSDLDDSTVVSYLRILYRVSECWIERNHDELNTEVELPRAALLIPEFENPFRMNLGLACKSHRAWGEWLTAELRKPEQAGHDRAQMSSIVPLLASAILYGGIWNEPELAALVRAIPNLLSCTMATANTVYMGLSVSWHGSGFTEFRSWQPDALTAILMMRTPSHLAEELLRPDPITAARHSNDATIVKRIKEQFETVRVAANGPRLCSFDLLIRSTVCIGYTQMPGVVAAYAHRRFISRSLSLSQMQRISDKEWLFGLPTPSNATAAAGTGTVANASELPPAPEWSSPIANALNVEDQANAVEGLRKLAVSGNTIIPLAKRMIDYARSEILLSPVARSTDSLRKFARGTAVLASFMAAELLEKDPRDLPDKDLQGLYKRMVERAISIPDGGDTVRDLTGALRQFHSYMRNCQEKSRLSDKGILAPPVLLDRVDVDLLSRDEYLEIRRRIRLRWPGTRNEDRRNIATCLVVLGAAGLRREEARLLRIGDVLYDGWEGVIVQPFGDHTVKSDSAKRKIPAEVFPAEDFEFLRKRREARPEKVRSQNGWLFGCEEFVCISPAIFRALNQIISDVTGTRSDSYPTHYHHLRKSFCSWGLFRLLLPTGCEPPDYMSKADRSWLIAGQNFRPQEIRRTDQPWNSDVFLMGQLLGHLDGRTTVSRYFHFCGELLRIYLSRSGKLSPTPEQFSLAVGNGSDPESKSSDSQTAMEFAVGLLGNMARLSGVIPAVVPSPANKQTSKFLTEIYEAWDLLSVVEMADAEVEKSGAAIDQAVADLGMGVDRAKAIRIAAHDLSIMKSGNGEFRHRFMELPSRNSHAATRSIIPVRPNDPFDNEIIKQFADRIEALRGRSILAEGVNAYVEFLWDSQGCPVFANPNENGSAAAAFLNLLYKLDIYDKDIRFGSFDCKGSTSRTEWRKVLDLRDRRPFERWQVPYQNRKSVRPWLGIKPTFGSGMPVQSPGLFGFRFIMLMTYIVLKADGATSREP